MVFSTLTQKDKEALFALLDEYFESRPELFQAMNNAASSHPPAQVNRAPSPPARPLSPSRMANTIQNGARNLLKSRVVPPAVTTSSSTTSVNIPPTVPPRQPTPRVVEPEPEPAQEEVDEAPVSVASRIAAAQAALGTTMGSGKPPVPTPRRTSGTAPPPPANKPSAATANKTSPPPRPFRPSPSASGASTPTSNAYPEANAPTTTSLVQSRGMGSIDTSSAGSTASTIFSFKGIGKNEKKPTGVYMPQTSAFEKPKTKELFAPPPRRDPGSVGSAGTSPAANNQVTLEEEEEEAAGEWCVALYDFSSSEPTDLSFKADDQIWVTERMSKDWWMAEIDGKSGLVPAAYVKLM